MKVRLVAQEFQATVRDWPGLDFRAQRRHSTELNRARRAIPIAGGPAVPGTFWPLSLRLRCYPLAFTRVEEAESAKKGGLRLLSPEDRASSFFSWEGDRGISFDRESEGTKTALFRAHAAGHLNLDLDNPHWIMSPRVRTFCKHLSCPQKIAISSVRADLEDSLPPWEMFPREPVVSRRDTGFAGPSAGSIRQIAAR